MPWIQCKEYDVVTVKVPWMESESGFTALFKALELDRLKEVSMLAVSRYLKLSRNAIDRIMQLAIKRDCSAVSPLSRSILG